MRRQVIAILLLPFMVVAAAPYWLLTTFSAADSRWSSDVLVLWLPRLAGVILGVAGLGLFGRCVHLFARVGKGTLAPWAPTQNLVVVGPYRLVRNPMISSVALMLAGQALFWGSWILGIWAGLFIALNHLYFVAIEEPGLTSRFGDSYRAYKAHVPRWLPRRRPWPE